MHFAILPKRKLYADQYKEYGKKDKLLIILCNTYNLYAYVIFCYKLKLTSKIKTQNCFQ